MILQDNAEVCIIKKFSRLTKAKPLDKHFPSSYEFLLARIQTVVSRHHKQLRNLLEKKHKLKLFNKK